jgi:hypothetical protein
MTSMARKVCDVKFIPNTTMIKKNQDYENLIYEYSKSNIAVLNIFIKDPFYSKIKRDEQVSISSTFYEQLLRAEIPKAKKKTENLAVFFALSGSVRVKAACRMLMILTPDDNSFIYWKCWWTDGSLLGIEHD